MNDKNINKNQENQREINDNNNQNQFSQSGIYLRDDHCDWGSSGMNEFTQEFSEKKYVLLLLIYTRFNFLNT
jgi:hypothetical protein